MVDLKMKLGKNQGEIFQKTSDIDELNKKVEELENKCQKLLDDLKN